MIADFKLTCQICCIYVVFFIYRIFYVIEELCYCEQQTFSCVLFFVTKGCTLIVILDVLKLLFISLLNMFYYF